MSNLRLAFVIDAVDRATAVVARVDKSIDRMTAPVRRVHAQWLALSRDPRVVNAMGRVLETAQPIANWARTVASGLASITLAAGGAAFALNRVVSRVSATADTAAGLGMTTERFSQLGFAAEQAGAGPEAMATGLAYLSEKLTEARAGGKEAIEWLSRVGVSMADLRNGIGASGAIDKIADTFLRVGDGAVNSANKIAASKAVFGRVGTSLVQVLSGGSAGLRAAAKESDRVGATLNSTVAANMKEYGDQVTKLDKSLFGLAVRVTSAALPAMNRVVDRLIGMSVASQDAWADRLGQSLGRLIDVLPDVLEGLLDIGRWLSGAGQKINQVVQAIGGWNTILAVLSGILLGSALFAVYSLTAAVVALGLAMWANPFGAMVLGVSVLGTAAVALIAYWEPVKTFFVDLWESIGRVLGMLGKVSAGPDPGAPSIYAGADAWARYRQGAAGAPVASATAGAPVPSAIGTRGAQGRQEVGGTLDIRITDEGKARISKVQKTPGSAMEINAYEGGAMAGS